MLFKKFEVEVNLRAADIIAIQVEDIPPIRQIKKIEVPRKPTIPVEDPEIDAADDLAIDMLDLDDFYDLGAPPPPPPEEEEIVPFFKVEVKPVLVGGIQAIADYITKHNLFPELARNIGVSGSALIGFIVDENGIPQDVKIIQEKPPEMGFGSAGVTVMEAMRFTPGMQRDKRVKVPMQQPIRFTSE